MTNFFIFRYKNVEVVVKSGSVSTIRFSFQSQCYFTSNRFLLPSRDARPPRWIRIARPSFRQIRASFNHDLIFFARVNQTSISRRDEQLVPPFNQSNMVVFADRCFDIVDLRSFLDDIDGQRRVTVRLHDFLLAYWPLSDFTNVRRASLLFEFERIAPKTKDCF